MEDPLFPAPAIAVELVQPTANLVGLSTLPFHVHEILLAFLTYQAIFVIAAPAVSRRLAPKTYESLSFGSRVNWDVHVVSMVQALFINACALWVIWTDVERTRMSWQERLWTYTGATGMVQAFAAGYFLWDLMVSVMHFRILGPGSLVHAISTLLVTSIGFRPFANYYGLNFILYELSTPFLNIHWFLDKLGMTGSRIQLYNGLMLVATFGGCRLIWGTYQSVLIYQDVWTAWTSDVPTGEKYAPLPGATVEEVLRHQQQSMPTWLAGSYLGANTILSVLNFYWFERMIAAVRKRFDPKGEAKAEKKSK
ncbi:MAG: hypothetical protein M1833_006124 [Piccolia ochrophora]|nr:MAG: hypothetical protein M1833_006124 [Piccolia ochrophora]